MKTRKSVLSLMFFALAGMVAISGPAAAKPVPGDLAQPQNLSCNVETDAILAAWDDVDDAKKYSVSVTANYILMDVVEPERTHEFDFGTGDRTDGDPASQSDLDIPLEDLQATFIDSAGMEVTVDPVSASLRVKGLNPGKGSGRQNHLFSESCFVDLAI